MGQKGAWPRSRDLLFKFWDPLISLKRLKVQNSNLARRLIVRDTKPKNKKMGQKGAWPRSGDLLFKF